MRSAAVSSIALLALAAAPALGLDTVTPAPEPAWGTKDTITLTVAIIGAVTGMLGAVLGGINTWNTISARRTRLKVIPAYAFPGEPQSSPPIFSIEVVNLSAFAVTVAEVGFGLSKGSRRAPVTSPTVMDGGKWPRRLEAREAVSVVFQPTDFIPIADEIRTAYVRLASGEIAKGTTPALKQLIEIMADVKTGRHRS